MGDSRKRRGRVPSNLAAACADSVGERDGREDTRWRRVARRRPTGLAASKVARRGHAGLVGRCGSAQEASLAARRCTSMGKRGSTALRARCLARRPAPLRTCSSGSAVKANPTEEFTNSASHRVRCDKNGPRPREVQGFRPPRSVVSPERWSQETTSSRRRGTAPARRGRPMPRRCQRQR